MTNLMTVSAAAAAVGKLPQLIHKYIRDNEIKTYEDPRSKKRMVDIDEVKAKVAGITRGRPEKVAGSNIVEGALPSAIYVRTKHQEIVRTIHVITGEAEGVYALRSSTDPEGFKDTWKGEKIDELLKKDEMFQIDRWRMLSILRQSFEVSGDHDIAATLKQIEENDKAASEERLQVFLDEQRGRIIEAEERSKIEKKQREAIKDKDF